MRQAQRDTRRERRGRASAPARAGFTLIELLIVVAIIGLIISLILVAAADGVRRAEERATQGLITKLETGLNDRLDALLNAQAPVNQTHRYLAAINYANTTLGSGFYPVGTVPTSEQGLVTTTSGADERRAQVIAQFDYVRAELPDVFFIQASIPSGTAFAATYPLNFAGSPYITGATGYGDYYLPLGNLYPGLPLDSNLNLTPNKVPSTSAPTYPPPLSGIFGASFSAAGGIYKNLYAAAASDVIAATPGTVINPIPAYDGVDNDGNGMIDEMTEVSVIPSSATGAFQTAVTNRLALHTHKTARAEMLYAILVEGLGPLGSVFNRDEFTNKQVQDTDGDGLPEFVDAWGEPILFFRWPIYFGTVAGSSDTQKGSAPYTGYSDFRQLDTLDANQLLVSPGWWAAVGNPGLTAPTGNPLTTFLAANPPGSNTYGMSQGALGFMHYFGSLVDPFPLDQMNGTSWDRTGAYARRSYFSKFLVLSSGSDKEPGVGQFHKDYASLTDDGVGTMYTFPDSTLSIADNVTRLILIENQASQTDPSGRFGSFFEVPDGSGPTPATSTTVYLQTNAGLDDISNHNTAAPGTGVR